VEKSTIVSMAAPCVRSARPARLAWSIGRRRALRLLVAVATVILAAAWAPMAAPARAQDAGSVERIAPDSNEHVFVSGVPDTFDDLRATIDRVKRETGRDYRVIVVGDGPTGIAISPGDQYIYVANTSGNTVSVIKLKFWKLKAL
jgi:NAD(P)-dependent dehydrogenase (short-subunit alcohol dehydrogenase family)